MNEPRIRVAHIDDEDDALFRELGNEPDISLHTFADIDSFKRFVLRQERQDLPEIVFIDVLIGGQPQGFEVLEWIKSQPDLGNCFCIACSNVFTPNNSGNSDEETRWWHLSGDAILREKTLAAARTKISELRARSQQLYLIEFNEDIRLVKYNSKFATLTPDQMLFVKLLTWDNFNKQLTLDRFNEERNVPIDSPEFQRLKHQVVRRLGIDRDQIKTIRNGGYVWRLPNRPNLERTDFVKKLQPST